MNLGFSTSAFEQLNALPQIDQVRIKNKLLHYADQKDPLKFAKRLVGHDVYRFRMGDFRVIFEKDRETLYILVIAKRDSIYKDL